jgi:hypothetical protein
VNRVAPWFDRWWPVVTAAVFPFVIALNYDALGMQGLYGRYVCFKEIILGGFDVAVSDRCPGPTFPMWGYGWLLLITESKLALLVLQNVVAIAAVWYFVRALERYAVLNEPALRLLKFLIVVSLPWYAFNSLRWPYSIAVSLVLTSLALLIRGVERGDATWPFALAGAAFGVALNFRSDYYLFPMVVAVAVLVFARARWGQRLRWAGAWLGAAYVLLAPWAIYTHHATGHYLLTSTNGGHVLYISLGNLPGNRWGITPSDHDPRMGDEIEARFGHRNTLIYESDVYLRSRWRELVAEQPREFARKLVHNTISVAWNGVYAGEYLEERHCQPHCMERYGQRGFGRRTIGVLTDGALSPEERARFAMSTATGAQARLVPLIAVLLLPFFLTSALLRRQFALVLTGLLFAFQTAMNIVTYAMSSYMTNVYVVMLLVLAWSVQQVLAYRTRRRARA